MAAARSRQKAPGYDFVPDAGGTLRAKAGDEASATAVMATARGVRISRGNADGFELGVETASVGRDGARHGGDVVGERAEGQELVIDREDGVEERLLAGPLGVEHSFEVRQRPQGEGPLVLEVAFAGFVPEAGGTGDQVLLRDGAGRVRAGYRDLVAADAGGRELAARMEVRGVAVALVIDDAAAAYPVRVDPLVWVQEAALTGADAPPYSSSGAYVAAVDGTTAVLGWDTGDYYADGGYGPGVALILARSGTTWSQQAAVTPADGGTGGGFGCSVAVSGDIAIVGALDYRAGTGGNQGASFVFVRRGTTWTQQAELTASDGATGDGFGSSVAVSGGAAVVGAPKHRVLGSAGQGAAYVFARSGTTWTQQAELTASDGAAGDDFGSSVAVSGGTAVVGAPMQTVAGNAEQGAAYIFAQSGTTWARQAELTASDGAAGDGFGSSVAVSGRTVIVGAPNHGVDHNEQGSAYIFVQDGAAWAEQVELTAGDGAVGGLFGSSVSISGGTAIVGALGYLRPPPGAAYIFVQIGTSWSQQAELALGGSDAGRNSWSAFAVGVSGDTAIVSAASDQAETFIFQREECAVGICTPVPDAGSGSDAGVTPDGGLRHDAGADARTGRDARPHDSSTDATKKAKDASASSSAGLHVSGPVGCGCRTAPGSETGASPGWLVLGAAAVLARRRSRQRPA
jgi:MYXO-CTERM domain-containing protein